MKPAIRILALTAMAALVAAALTGCGTKAHQVVTDEGACLTCHKGDFAVDRSGKFSTSGAVYSTTGQLTVTVTGVDAFFVCRAMPTTQGEKAIPVPILLRGPISITQGEPFALALEPGNYVLVLQKDGKVANQLVIVDPSATGKTVDAVTLKL